jgi:four helix bundle protein
VSIPANIAEGHRRPRQAYLNHLSIALGSHAELETLIELAVRLGVTTPEAARPVQELTAEVGRLTHGLARSLNKTEG